MSTQEDKATMILDTALTAGKIMMESGSEVYRAEDTMNRIASNAGENSVSYVTATGLFIGLKHKPYTMLENVTERSINLEKVAVTNQLSREFAEKKINLKELNHRLKHIDDEALIFPFWLQLIAAGVVSCTLMYIFGGSWLNFLPAFVIGSAGYGTSYFVKGVLDIKYLNDFVAAFVIGLLAHAVTLIHPGFSVDYIIIGAVMPLVPGVAITNSFRDILAGHLISGMARGTEAILIAGAIGVGIGLVFKIFM